MGTAKRAATTRSASPTIEMATTSGHCIDVFAGQCDRRLSHPHATALEHEMAEHQDQRDPPPDDGEHERPEERIIALLVLVGLLVHVELVPHDREYVEQEGLSIVSFLAFGRVLGERIPIELHGR